MLSYQYNRTELSVLGNWAINITELNYQYYRTELSVLHTELLDTNTEVSNESKILKNEWMFVLLVSQDTWLSLLDIRLSV